MLEFLGGIATTIIDKLFGWIATFFPKDSDEAEVYIENTWKVFENRNYMYLNSDKVPEYLNSLLMDKDHGKGIYKLKILERQNLKKNIKSIISKLVQLTEMLKDIEELNRDFFHNHYNETMRLGNEMIEIRKQLAIEIDDYYRHKKKQK